jgi:hypothetical protein
VRSTPLPRFTSPDAGQKKVGAELDAEWTKGQAWAQEKQRQEEALLAKGKEKQVFSY